MLGLMLKMAFSDTVRQRVLARMGEAVGHADRHDVPRTKTSTTSVRCKRPTDFGSGARIDLCGQCARAPKGTEHAATSRRQQSGRGGGGAWRAHASKKRREGASMGSQGGSYRVRTDEEIADDQRAGIRATQEHRDGNACSFGLHRRDRDSVTSAVSMVRRSLRFDAATSRAHEAELDSAIAACSSCEGAAAVVHVVDAIPLLKEVQARLASVPTSERDVDFHVRHHSDSDVVVADAFCASYSPELKRLAGTLNKSLDTHWAWLDKPIDGDDWKGPSLLGVRRRSECWRAGHCLCDGSGILLKRFRNAFIQT